MFAEDNIQRKRKRMFHRMATGLQIARNQDADMYFMTLTTSKQRVLNRKGVARELTDSFRLLKQKIRFATIERCRFEGFRFNRYYCLKTEEGNGVLHIVFWGRFIPIEWLRSTWERIHGAFEVGISQVKTRKGRVNGLVGYLLDRYLINQKAIKRMSYGWKWAWLGFCKSWKNVKQHYGQLKSGKGSLLPIIVHITANKPSHPGAFRHFVRPRFAAIEAWHCTLWKCPITSRQQKVVKYF